VPLRRQLVLLDAPRPLRFPRLVFQPLNPLIVAAARWRTGQRTIPRSVILPIADHVRVAMGGAATAIEASMAGRTTADTEFAAELGRSLWPAAARILADAPIPKSWAMTDLADPMYRPLADIVAAVLVEADALDGLRAGRATRVLPPRREIVEALLNRVGTMNPAGLAPVIAVLLSGVPEAAPLLRARNRRGALDEAAEILLRQLGHGAEIGGSRLVDAGAAAGRIVTLLEHLADANAATGRGKQLRLLRQQFDAECTARFTSGLRNEFLARLPETGATSSKEEIIALEAAARGLRALGAEAPAFGSGSTYHRMLSQAAATIRGEPMRDRFRLTDRIRLVEILAGSDVALEMLEQRA
jgi:hypothetical protein